MDPAQSKILVTDVADRLGTAWEGLAENATGFTCVEAEALFELLAVCDTLNANDFMVAHVAGDDCAEGDMHRAITAEPRWERV